MVKERVFDYRYYRKGFSTGFLRAVVVTGKWLLPTHLGRHVGYIAKLASESSEQAWDSSHVQPGDCKPNG